jgi:SET domain-containing protein
MGWGVFTQVSIQTGTILEISPVIVMNAAEKILLDRTLLHDYIFKWGDHEDKCCLALGYVSIYNHSYNSNCEYEMDFTENKIIIKAVQQITAGQELFINYNGNCNDKTPVWFDAI